MLLVKTYLAKSEIEGLGLFLAQPVKKGTITWLFEEGFDLKISESELEALSDSSKEYIKKYGYLSQRSGLYIVCLDNSRFMNHSDNPTTAGLYRDDLPFEGADVALRDLEIGEELTCDYRTFEVRKLDWLK